MPQPATAKIIIRFFFVEGHCQPAGECKKNILVVLTHCTLKIPATLMILVSQNEDDIWEHIDFSSLLDVLNSLYSPWWGAFCTAVSDQGSVWLWSETLTRLPPLPWCVLLSLGGHRQKTASNSLKNKKVSSSIDMSLKLDQIYIGHSMYFFEGLARLSKP